MNTSPLSTNAAWCAVVAEAATWIALLHGPDRTLAAERGLKRWLAEDPLHAKAFELATETWNEARASVKRGAKVKLILPGEKKIPRHKTQSGALAAAAAVAAIVVGIVVAMNFYRQQSGVATEVGERRILTLEDGTQVYLNTATRLVVNYGTERRHVRLESGEALFEVAKRPDRPFVVSAGERDITALGTAFLVRRDEERVSVTLVEGKVAVSGASDSATVLSPGERLTYPRFAQAPKVDRPELDKLTAWQNGKVNIDNLTLAEASAEMNRYSRVQLEVQGGEASSLRLSGIFRIGDSKNFANAVARTHGLRIEEEGRRIVLSGVPRPPAAQ
jgi:transmembrane sensor